MCACVIEREREREPESERETEREREREKEMKERERAHTSERHTGETAASAQTYRAFQEEEIATKKMQGKGKKQNKIEVTSFPHHATSTSPT